ncbi:MAG TPA: hypothetical protein VFX78_11555 [Candidatus Eisenbacteria bacterium]|jgi:hypothetical protein|nr:hypothetical protein [Candidatus Eisenbacteria bacterium]
MNTIFLVLAGEKTKFRICAAFDLAPFAKSYAAAFKHHGEAVWVEEVAEGLDQDFRVGDKPYVVRFDRGGTCLGVLQDPPLEDFLGHSPPHRIAEDQATVEIFRWAPDPASARHEAEARLDYPPLKAWVQRPG